jgi:Uncharacterized conserved protein
VNNCGIRMSTLYFVTDRKSRDSLRNGYRRGELFRIRQGIYIDSSNKNDVENILNQQWYKIAKYLFEDAIAVFRTAVELKPVEGRIYLLVRGLKRRTVTVGPLQFVVDSGIVDKGIEPFVPEMNRSNLPRQWLENLTPARAKSGIKKTLGKDWVEAQLIQEVEKRGEQGLNRIRDEATGLAPVFGFEKEFDTLNKMISAILKTHPAKGILQTRAGIAHAAGEPFDRERLDRFRMLAAYLLKVKLTAKPYIYNKTAWKNLAFFESYFSNYIEGTKFTIDEAEKIVSTGKETYNRHEDSHDILSHIEISGDHAEMTRVPGSPEELINILKVRHSILLAQRQNKRPGQFKEISNRAGSTVFVEPEMVAGTLIHGYDIYKEIPKGILRALFMHFLVAECHPFDDGNGRMARIMMNAELVSNDLCKIIVPTVCGDNYLGGLRQASRQNKFRTIVKVLHQLQQYIASINWMDYGDARKTLEEHAADKEPDEGLMVFNKIISKFNGDYQAD